MTRDDSAKPARLASLRAGIASSTLARGALIALAIQGVAAASRYLVQVLFARWGGAVEYGRYAYAITWAQLLVVPATIGLSLTVLRFVPLYIQDEKWALLRGIVRKSSQVSVLEAPRRALAHMIVDGTHYASSPSVWGRSPVLQSARES